MKRGFVREIPRQMERIINVPETVTNPLDAWAALPPGRGSGGGGRQRGPRALVVRPKQERQRFRPSVEKQSVHVAHEPSFNNHPVYAM